MPTELDVDSSLMKEAVGFCEVNKAQCYEADQALGGGQRTEARLAPRFEEGS